jgi:hypothetical protein
MTWNSRGLGPSLRLFRVDRSESSILDAPGAM